MDKTRNIDNFLKMQDRINKKTQTMKNNNINNNITQPRKIDYNQIHKKFKIICNNTVNAGDCYGETMCACKCFLYDNDYHKYYSKEPQKEDLHHDFRCNNCGFHICGCCYSVCPNCGKSDNVIILPH